ncbi:hypothetical protein GGR50DRAFT_25547 [Xylaria sp. CBS 124048]|nr:hypothetical protein GGR50DRAFT_25547 [Xylaria sp. CBS 124048]
MNTTLPPKRRALASIDTNTRSPLSAPRLSPSKANLTKPKMALGPSRVDLGNSLKRPIEQESNREAPGSAAKKRRLSGLGTMSLPPRDETPAPKDADNATTTRLRSTSPEDPSVFDSSMDNSNVTTITEPEAEAAAAATAPIPAPAPAPAPATVAIESLPRPGHMTREEARRKAEILRLRLGLASYKVKTNQADVPLEKLQFRPLLGRVTKATRPPVVLLPPLPPLPCASPRRSSPASRRNVERRFDSWTKSRGETSPTLPAATPSSSQRRESCVSVAHTQVDEKSPARIREPERTLLPSPAALNKPQHRVAEQDEGLSDVERGGAAEGLLSLSQGSPGSALK